jgi:S-methylmethionine-dependent homocysteine/selenocysteine methylase/SAM-dependent methyltransferase
LLSSPSVSRHTLGAGAYERLKERLAGEHCVILDGGIGTELQRSRPPQASTGLERQLWGTWALYQAPHSVLDVHRRYVDSGCDVISTDTWSILTAPEVEQSLLGPSAERSQWMDIARLGIRLPRQAIAEAGREGSCAVAFAISQEVNSPTRRETVELLARVFEEDPPDVVLLETITLIRDPATYQAVELLLEMGFPVWLSFRRCRHGVCGVYGQHWGPPEGDLFGRAARRFESMGVGALLINCLPVEHVRGMISWLRDFTEMPLGVYPNLGHMVGRLWHFDEHVGPEQYAQRALQWRAEGAQIIGGCCGTTPEHIAAVAAAVVDTRPGRQRPLPHIEQELTPEPEPQPWLDEQGRSLYPLPFPPLTVEPGVFVPTQGSYLCWKHLFQHRIGKGEHCLDVGCGCGILAVQLALNGAAHVHAIDIDRNAIANTLANAFRNGVVDRMTAADVDLYQWEPDQRYDVCVASLYQMPVDPFQEPSGHRPLDYWGRNLLDHFIAILPRLLTENGKAYVMQLSIIGQRETARQLHKAGLAARVVDYTFFPFSELFEANREQIERVEQLSDAFALRVADKNVMVAYLLEITRRASP